MQRKPLHPTTKNTPKFHTQKRVNKVTAATATGKRPDPSRTRKLSLPAPMILTTRGEKQDNAEHTPTSPVPPKTLGVHGHFQLQATSRGGGMPTQAMPAASASGIR